MIAAALSRWVQSGVLTLLCSPLWWSWNLTLDISHSLPQCIPDVLFLSCSLCLHHHHTIFSSAHFYVCRWQKLICQYVYTFIWQNKHPIFDYIGHNYAFLYKIKKNEHEQNFTLFELKLNTKSQSPKMHFGWETFGFLCECTSSDTFVTGVMSIWKSCDKAIPRQHYTKDLSIFKLCVQKWAIFEQLS